MARLQGKFLATSAVNARVLATDAVETIKIKNAAVTAEKLADSCINSVSKIDAAIINVANGIVQLNASGKVPVTLLPNAIMEYKGLFTPGTTVLKDYADAETAAEHIGDVWRASAAGEHDFGDGTPRLVTFGIGDYAICNELGVWERADTSDAVVSVNGKTGAVTLVTDDVAEGVGATNLWFTDARAKAAAVADEIVDGVTDVAPSQNAVYDALALKADDSVVVKSVNGVSPTAGAVTISSDDVGEGSTNLYFTDARAKSAAVSDSITDGVTDVAPSQNAVFDEIARLEGLVSNAAAKSHLHTLTAGEVTARAFDLPDSPLVGSLGAMILYPVGGIPQTYSVDFSVSGATISWPELTGMGELGLVEGDQIQVVYY